MNNYLKNRKGSILEYIIVIVAVCSIAVKLIPQFNEAFNKRQETTIQIYNGDDTVTNYK